MRNLSVGLTSGLTDNTKCL